MLVAVLDNIRSIYNVGSAFRTADGLGVDKLYLCGQTASPDGKNLDRVNKTALGAEESVAWDYSQSTTEVITKLKKEDFLVLAIEKTESSIDILTYTGDSLVKSDQKIALVFGNEVYGVSEAALSLSDDIVHLPMTGKKSSYNVSIAFALACAIFKWDFSEKI